MNIRSILYRTASLLGWINAILKGKLLQRIARVGIMRFFGSIISRVRW